MNDPLPSNIVGEKTVSHTVEHRVRWDYVLIAAVALYGVWKAASIVGRSVSVEETEENNQVPALGMEA